MITRTATKRFEESNFKTIIKPFFESQGFKFKKKEGTKNIGDFVLTFTCYSNDHYRCIYFNPRTQSPEIQYVSYLRVWHPAFNTWCHENFFGYHLEAKNSVANLHFTLPIDTKQFSQNDFTTQINSNPKNGLNIQDLGFHSFIDLMNPDCEQQNWYSLIEQTIALADLESMYCHDSGKPGKCICLIYLNENERAILAANEYLQLSIKAYQEEPKLEYKQSWLSRMKYLQSFVKQFLNIELVLPTLLEWKSEQGQKTGTIPIININWRELYKLTGLPRPIYRSFMNERDGTLMTLHDNGNYKGEIVFWDINGKTIQHIEFNSIQSVHFLGFIPEVEVYFMSNLLIFKNGDTAYLPIDKVVDGNGQMHYERVCTDVVYDSVSSNYIVCSIKDRHNYCVWFFNENFEVVKTFEVQGKPTKIYTDKKWIVVLDDKENNCKIIDYCSAVLHSFETRNAMFHHQFIDNYRWLIVYGYYSHSEVCELATQNTFKIYAHPTFISGYKDNFQLVEHNFGLSALAVSPDAKYVVGSAEHGKWVTWSLPNWKRQEILPNKEYLYESLEPYSFEINGESFFVNNGKLGYFPFEINEETGSTGVEGLTRSSYMNIASAIYFIDNGKYFLMQIEEKLLIFDNQFQHLTTYKGLGNMLMKGKYLLTRTEQIFSVSVIEQGSQMF